MSDDKNGDARNRSHAFGPTTAATTASSSTSAKAVQRSKSSSRVMFALRPGNAGRRERRYSRSVPCVAAYEDGQHSGRLDKYQGRTAIDVMVKSDGCAAVIVVNHTQFPLKTILLN